MRVQGIKSLVAAVSSVLTVGLVLSIGSQPGDLAAVPVAPAAHAAAPRVLTTTLPDLPSLSRHVRAPVSDDLPGIFSSTAASGYATSQPPEEAPGEDTKVLTTPSSVPTIAIPSVTKQTSGALLSMPIQGRKTSRFGMRFHPVRHIWKLHSGLDLAAPCGTPVGAAAPGTVVRTGWAGGNGIQVKIDHGTMAGHRVMTTYNHLSAIGVSVGQKVETHQGVGRVGTTGFSTGCHLHFEVIADGQFTNPEPWLNGSAVVVDTQGMGTGQAVVPGSTRPGTPSSTLPVSPTRTASPSPSPSNSPSPSGAPSLSASPSASTSPSPSASSSVTGSPKPCSSPSVKPSQAPTPSQSPCASPSPSPSPSASPSPSPSASTLPASPTPTPSDSPDPSASGSPSSTGTPAPSPSTAPPSSSSAAPVTTSAPPPSSPGTDSSVTRTTSESAPAAPATSTTPPADSPPASTMSVLPPPEGDSTPQI